MRAGERESQIIGVNSSNADPTLTLLRNQTDNLAAITGISEPVIIAPTQTNQYMGRKPHF